MQYINDFKFIACVLYLVVINIIAFISYGADKRKAKKGKWRISEKTLILLALFGGSVGAVSGMKVFRHKTKKAIFSVGIPIILILQLLMMAVLLYK